MSEEVLETPNTEESTEETETPEEELSAEDWKQIALKARREAANRRMKGKEIEAKLSEYEDWKKSQMSEVDRVKAEKAEVERELKGYRRGELQIRVAEKVKLDVEYADLILGDSEEEMVDNAKRLKIRLDPKSATTQGLRPGARGAPVAATNDSVNEWFRNAYHNA